ncbi:hypothetical protein KC331_g1551 [Hortaea werneckii]|nr:hypothetical protein KC331_g1551 [Hortaea werneckii]KAI7721109.1 hypothetical protein KC353_g1637 [Hortaea werneckii]
MPPNELCPICAERATRSCPTCWEIRYCSPECREADYSAHSYLCGKNVDGEFKEAQNEGKGVTATDDEGKAIEPMAGKEDAVELVAGVERLQMDGHDKNHDPRRDDGGFADNTNTSSIDGKETTKAIENGEASDIKRKIIFFPAGTIATPIFFSTPIHEILDEETGEVVCQQPKMEKIFNGKLWADFQTIDRNAYTEQPLGYHIHLCHMMKSDVEQAMTAGDPTALEEVEGEETSQGDDAQEEGEIEVENKILPLNEAIANATDHRATYPWRGPIVAFCGRPDTGPDADIIEVYDMDMEAYSHVMAHLIDYENTSTAYLSSAGPKVHGVKVLCDGELRMDMGERFRSVKVPRCHPMVRTPDSEMSQISQRIGMPLVFARYPVDENTDAENRFIMVMLSSLEQRDQLDQPMPDDDELDFGFTRDYWAHNVGSVLAFHEDLVTPLDPKTLRHFAEFCDHVAHRFLRRTHEDHNEEKEGVLTVQEALSQITKESWEEFVREL